MYADFVTHATVMVHGLFLGRGMGGESGRVFEACMHDASSCWEDRAGLVRRIADGDDEIEVDAEVFRAIGGVRRDVHAGFGHCFDGECVQAVRVGTGGVRVDGVRLGCFAQPSAIWLRQELPVQRNSRVGRACSAAAIGAFTVAAGVRVADSARAAGIDGVGERARDDSSPKRTRYSTLRPCFSESRMPACSKARLARDDRQVDRAALGDLADRAKPPHLARQASRPTRVGSPRA